jgi:dye decolorizing peroxidase
MAPISRRDVLISGVATGVGAGVAGIVTGTIGAELTAKELQLARDAQATAVRDASVPFLGDHQAGIELELQTFTNFLSFEVDSKLTLDDFERWMRLLTDDIARLAVGQPVLADAQPQLALGPARLSVTLGLGPNLFSVLGIEGLRPEGFAQVPPQKIDKLQDQFSGGDLLLHVSADDPIVLSHAARALIRDSLPFATVKWSQQGFSNAQGVTPGGVRQRNLMGQVDGTDNPELGSKTFADTVWIDEDSTDSSWLVGGTQLVLRRIAMNLDTWDKLGRDEKERVIGRNLQNGAPLGQQNETDFPDFNARKPNGLPQIPNFAHIRNASARTPSEVFFRRPFNYEAGVSATGHPDVGLLWAAYARDLTKQYLPVQERLSKVDMLNLWTTPIGSSVWLIPPGVPASDQLLCGGLIGAARSKS